MKYLIIILTFMLTSCVFKAKEEIKTLESTNDIAQKIKFNLLNTVLENLNLEKENCKLDLIVWKETPNNIEETIIVITEIVNEGEQYFSLNSYILIVNSKTGKIKYKYFESSKTNSWVSDAIMLRKITIDTAPYNVSDDSRAFGIRVRRVGSSHANPYENETISLFVKSENELKNILRDFTTLNYSGEWDTDCVGKFIGSKSTLIISKEKTNNYFNILVKSKIIETTNFEDENGLCDSKENSTKEQTILKFNHQEYKNTLK